MSDTDKLEKIINYYTPVIYFLMSAREKIRQQTLKNTTARNQPELGIEEQLAITELPEDIYFGLMHIVPVLITFQTEIILKVLLLKTRESGYEYAHTHRLAQLWKKIPTKDRELIEKRVKEQYVYPEGYQTVMELLEIYDYYYLDVRYLRKNRIGKLENKRNRKRTDVVPYKQMMDLNSYLIEIANTLTPVVK
ncbi:MAG: hypothetical protein OXG88_07815 [Gammaproteobacteria bacterium]|nr:hypothetical protein [Gammaproteobacteria bacterium]